MKEYPVGEGIPSLVNKEGFIEFYENIKSTGELKWFCDMFPEENFTELFRLIDLYIGGMTRNV